MWWPGAVVQSTTWHRHRGCVQEDRNGRQPGRAVCYNTVPCSPGTGTKQSAKGHRTATPSHPVQVCALPLSHQAGPLRTLVVVQPLLSDRERPLPQTLLQITHPNPNPTAGPAGAMLRGVHSLAHRARGQPSLSSEVLEVQGPGVLELRHRWPMRTGQGLLVARARLLISTH